MISKELTKLVIKMNKVSLICSNVKLKTPKTNFKATSQNKHDIGWQKKQTLNLNL